MNNHVGYFTFVHCAETDEQAMRNGAAAWCTVTALRFYAELGIDRLMRLHQIGGPSEDAVDTSIRLIDELIPEFDR